MVNGAADGDLTNAQINVGLSRAYSIPVSEASILRTQMPRERAVVIARGALAQAGGGE